MTCFEVQSEELWLPRDLQMFVLSLLVIMSVNIKTHFYNSTAQCFLQPAAHGQSQHLHQHSGVIWTFSLTKVTFKIILIQYKHPFAHKQWNYFCTCKHLYVEVQPSSCPPGERWWVKDLAEGKQLYWLQTLTDGSSFVHVNYSNHSSWLQQLDNGTISAELSNCSTFFASHLQ